MMKRFLASVVAIGLGAVSGAQQAGVAATPPMGWNSWDSWGLTITEAEFRANVQVLHDKLQPFGWNNAVIDEGWYFENPKDRETPGKLRYAIDENGRYVPVPDRFPSAAQGVRSGPFSSPAVNGLTMPATIEPTSFRTLGAWVHGLGLQFGIHIIRGIPKVSVERNLPIAGSNFHAEDAADRVDTCPWDPTSWGVKDNAAGQAWYNSLLTQYASWGVDYIKVDCVSDHPYKASEIRMIRKAIDTVGRPMVLSLSPGPTNLSHAAEVTELANMWRISDDFWDRWAPDAAQKQEYPQSILRQFSRFAAWEPYAGPGHWPDGDMLPIGELRPFPGEGQPRHTKLTPDEQRTMLTLWAMARSPLILGANLTLLDAATLEMLTNKDLIAIDQTSIGAREAKREETTIVWRSTLRDGREAVAVFNAGDTPLDYKAKLAEVDAKLGRKAWTAKDVWAKRNLGRISELSATVPVHGAVVWMLR